jgi:predicted regulator of Ras-like GTPase activity (Roadblock/LC7/MglB family)
VALELASERLAVWLPVTESLALSLAFSTASRELQSDNLQTHMYNGRKSSALVVKANPEQVYTAQLKEQLDLKDKKHTFQQTKAQNNTNNAERLKY